MMKRNTIGLLATLGALVLVGSMQTAVAQSHGGHGNHGHAPQGRQNATHQHTEAPAQTNPVKLVDGVQVAEILIGPKGFVPVRLELKAGVPARLVFTRVTDQTCATEVQIPGVGVGKTKLPLNEPVKVEFTPEKTGEFTFACGMDMLKGTLLIQS